jgi:hypothetical protein
VFDRLADMLEHHVDMSRITRLAGLRRTRHSRGGVALS